MPTVAKKLEQRWQPLDGVEPAAKVTLKATK
jgi:hypothetical protein